MLPFEHLRHIPPASSIPTADEVTSPQSPEEVDVASQGQLEGHVSPVSMQQEEQVPLETGQQPLGELLSFYFWKWAILNLRIAIICLRFLQQLARLKHARIVREVQDKSYSANCFSLCLGGFRLQTLA